MKNNSASSLFHYTNCIGALEGIITEGLFPNYCKESFSYNGKTEIVGIPMVSFCDIPFMRIESFSDRYGKYAIGLSKEWGLRNRINPVFYAANEDVVAGLWFFRSYQQMLREKLRKAGGNEKTITVNLTPGSLPELADLINHGNAKSAVTVFYALIKRYESEYKGELQVNYIESEWRYVVGDGENSIDWLWGEDSYFAWRGSERKPDSTESLKDKRLRFKTPDVKHIIIENEADRDLMIGWIDKLEVIGGESKLTDNDKKMLISRIDSVEQMALDY